MIKIKMILMLAIALTMFTDSAKAQWGISCDVNSQQQIITAEICGVDMTFEICWTCPTGGLGATTLKVALVGGMIFDANIPFIQPCGYPCVEIAKWVLEWQNLSTLCPDFTSNLNPCDILPKKVVEFRMPLCWKWKTDLIGSPNLEPCLPIQCYCVARKEYCFNGSIVEVTELPSYTESISGGSCPSGTCDVPISSIPYPTTPDTYSSCGYLCE